MANEGICYRHIYLVLQCSLFHLINCIFPTKVHFGKKKMEEEKYFFSCLFFLQCQRKLNSHFSITNANKCHLSSSLFSPCSLLSLTIYVSDIGEEEKNCFHTGGLQKNSRIIYTVPSIMSCLETVFCKCLCLLVFLRIHWNVIFSSWFYAKRL